MINHTTTISTYFQLSDKYPPTYSSTLSIVLTKTEKEHWILDLPTTRTTIVILQFFPSVWCALYIHVYELGSFTLTATKINGDDKNTTWATK